MTMKCTAFLCGGFSLSVPDPDVRTVDPAWQRLRMNPREAEAYGKYYYPEFVTFNYGGEPAAKRWKSMVRYRLPVDRQVTVFTQDGELRREQTIRVAHVTLYVAPFRLMLYAVQVEQEADTDDVTATMAMLRNVNGYRQEAAGEFMQAALDPLMKLFGAFAAGTDVPLRESDYGLLVENGNKFKLFRIADLTAQEWAAAQTDHLLFELGTLGRAGSYGADPMSASEVYYTRTMQQYRISIFENWKALSLFDTFTILSRETPDWLHRNWIDDYFHTIYISQLYVRIYLFRLNILFRRQVRDADSLVREFEEFERNCCFHNISYNFLPQEIFRGMVEGLDIVSEKEQLFRMIAHENERREKNSDQRMNNLLFFLTCLTMFSAIWDSSCLFNELYPYDQYIGSHLAGYRLVAYSLLLLIMAAIVLNRMLGRRSR